MGDGHDNTRRTTGAELRLGIPSHPQEELVDWIRWTREHGFAFIELFIEEPAAGIDRLDRPAVRRALRRELAGFPCLGHLPPCLPLGSPFPELRRAVVAVTVRYARFFAAIGCPAMTVHANWASSLIPVRMEIDWQRDTLAAAAAAAQREGVRLLFELIPHRCDSPAHDAAIIAGIPNLGYTLDVGHANLHGYSVGEYLRRRELFAALHHLHLHDNDGKGDRHWPIVSGKRRAGGVHWGELMTSLQQQGYRGTMTLEFHAGGRRAFLAARRYLQELWTDAGGAL